MSSCNLTMNKSGRGYTERVLVNGTPSLLFERLKKGDLQSIPNQTIQEAIEAKVITNPNNFLERAMLLYNLALQQKSFGLDKLGEPLLEYKGGQFVPYKAIRSSLNDDRYIDNSLIGNATKVSSEAIRISERSNTKALDNELAKKIQAKLEKLYPEIKLNITNTPIWEKGGSIFNQEEFSSRIDYMLKATQILLSNKAKQVFAKGLKNKWSLDSILTELQVPKEQKQLIIDMYNNMTIYEDKVLPLREQLALELVINYNYIIEIETTIGSNKKPTQFHSNLTVAGGVNYTENEIATPLITPSIKGHAQFATDQGIGWFRSDEQTIINTSFENNIEEELKIRDNWSFTQDVAAWQGYGDDVSLVTKEDKIEYLKNNSKPISKLNTKTRRILEVQSDLFQKGRDKKDLTTIINSKIEDWKYKASRSGINIENGKIGYNEDSDKWYIVTERSGTKDITLDEAIELSNGRISKQENNKGNQFLQLLNKDNNWVTFFLKSILQDSAKKGYEKVLFPRLDSVIEIESTGQFITYQEADEYYRDEKWQEKDKKLREILKKHQEVLVKRTLAGERTVELQKEIIAQKERIRSHQPSLLNTANFYEYDLANKLDDLVGGTKSNRAKNIWALKRVTDEYGNTWNEVTINQVRDLADILLQRNEANQIIGQANIKAGTVLIDAINQRQDTLPHEYAHHYIAWFRDTPIVQEAINKWGSEEALVQSIGEQVVAQKGEAWNWWNKFVKWVMNKFNSLSKLQKQELTQILTDAFLTRQDLNLTQDTLNFTPDNPITHDLLNKAKQRFDKVGGTISNTAGIGSFYQNKHINIDPIEVAKTATRLGISINEATAQVMLHELIHFVFDGVKSSRLMELYTMYKTNRIKNGLSYEQSFDEFLARALSDKVLIEELQSIDTKGKDIRIRKGGAKSILRRLIETFTRVFSPNEETSTMYADILHFYFTYSNENAPILDSTNQKLFFSGQNFVPIDLTNATLEQNLTYQKLMGVHSSGQFNEAEHTYQDANGNSLTSVTKLIEKSVGPNGEENYFGFDGDSSIYEWNREVGNQLDSILETVINGGTISQAEQVINELAARSVSRKIHLSLQQIGKAYNEFRSQFSRYNSEGIVWVTQVRIFDDNAGLAGTADIIGIHKDGSLSIIDLKSSVNPFNSTYSTGGFKNSYSTPFKTRDGKVKASKKTKHSAQVTIYSRMLMNLGFAITDSNPLSVKPVLITTNDTNGTKEVEDLVFEVPLIPLALSPEIAKVFKDTGRTLYKTSVTDLEVFKVIDSIAVQLQRRIKQMDNEGKNSYFQKTWLNNLNNIASLEPFISFLDSLIKDLLGEQDAQKRSLPNSWKGWIDNGRKQLDAIKRGTAHSSYSNSFAKLNELITALELYMPILNATDNLLSKFEDNDRIQVNSVLNQIRIAKSKATSLLNDLKEESINLLAENMSNATDTTEVSESEDLNLIAIAEEISKLEELEQSGTLSRLDKLRLSKARKRRDRRLKTYDNKRISTDKDGKVAVDKKYSSTIDEFKALLGGERKDVSFLEATTISAIMSSSKVLATFAKIVKEEFEKTRISLIKVRKNLGKEFNAYLASTNINRDNVAAFNKPFYEVINVFNSQTKEITKKVFFKSEINWNLYYENLAKLTAELDAKVEAKVITISERNSKLSEWYKANQEVNLEDITMKDPITGKEVVMFRGINSIVAQKRQELEDTFGRATVYNSATRSYELRSELEYSKWVLKNTYEDKVTKERVWMIPEIKLPISSKYRKQLNMSAEEARFHSALVYTYLEAQLNVPIGKRMGLQIPSIPKNSNDRWRELMRDKGVLEGSKGYISKEVDETIGALDARHEEKYGTNDGNSLPVLYSNREIKLEDVSLDLTSSVLRYTAMAKNYKSRSKLLPMANSLLKTLETNRPLKTDSNGNKFLSLVSKVSGKKLYEESKKDHTLEALDSFIKTQFYLQPRKLEDDMLSPKQQRIVDMLTKFMSITSVSILKPLSNLANALTAETNVLIESFVTQHISLPSWMKTNTLVLDVEKDFITDFNSVYPTTLWKMFFDLYDPVQGTFNDRLGRKMTHSQAKRAWSTDTLFLGLKRGEFQAQMRLAMSVLNEFQVFTLANPNDKIPMLDALEVRNGELKLKAGYGYMLNGRFVSNPFNQQLQHKIHGLNKLLHGIYNSFDRVAAERDSVGRLLLLYRKFLPAGLRRRWGNSGQLNVELGDREFADYRALASMLTYIVTDLKNFKKYLDPSNTDLILHPNEIYAARRAFAELSTIVALGIMLSVLFRLKDLDDDEEKDWFLDASTYSLFRLMTEVSTFVHPFSLYRSFRSPSAIYGIVTKTVTLLQQALQDLFNMELEEYKQDSGLARKGDSKLFHNFLKMLNLNGVTVDPQLGLDILELQVNK